MDRSHAISFVVVCRCTGLSVPLAYIDDNRLGGGEIAVSVPPVMVDGVPRPSTPQLVFADDVVIDRPGGAQERRPIEHGYAASKWAEYTVTQTFWNNSNVSWTIRCDGDCGQAQMGVKALAAVADLLGASLDVLERLVGEIDTTERHVIPLKTLNVALGRIDV